MRLIRTKKKGGVGGRESERIIYLAFKNDKRNINKTVNVANLIECFCNKNLAGKYKCKAHTDQRMITLMSPVQISRKDFK